MVLSVFKNNIVLLDPLYCMFKAINLQWIFELNSEGDNGTLLIISLCE